jgi:hypothetical protein
LSLHGGQQLAAGGNAVAPRGGPARPEG